MNYTEQQHQLMWQLLQTFEKPIYPGDIDMFLYIVHKFRLLSNDELQSAGKFLELMHSNKPLDELGKNALRNLKIDQRY